MLSPNVSVVSTTRTTEGDTVTLQCEDGLFPVISVMITCNSAGVWSSNPAELVCTTRPGMYDQNKDRDKCKHSFSPCSLSYYLLVSLSIKIM